jgi:hypothetical protein
LKSIPRLRKGLVFKAHRLVYHPTPGSSVINKKEEKERMLSLGIDRRFPLEVRKRFLLTPARIRR